MMLLSIVNHLAPPIGCVAELVRPAKTPPEVPTALDAVCTSGGNLGC